MIDDIHTTLTIHLWLEKLAAILTITCLWFGFYFVSQGGIGYILATVMLVLAGTTGKVTIYMFLHRKLRNAIRYGSVRFVSDAQALEQPNAGWFIEGLDIHFKKYMKAFQL